jgi:hypothetical protein
MGEESSAYIDVQSTTRGSKVFDRVDEAEDNAEV